MTGGGGGGGGLIGSCSELRHLARRTGAWLLEEDQLLLAAVGRFGKNWQRVAEFMVTRHGYRVSKSCRERYSHILEPGVDRSAFREDEDEFVLHMFSWHGPRWALMAAQLPGRTDNAVKNRWNGGLARRYEAGEASAFDPVQALVEWAAEDR